MMMPWRVEATRNTRPRTDSSERGVRALWLQTGMWAAFALGAGLGALATHGWLQPTLFVLAIVFLGLAGWVSLIATLFTAVGRATRSVGRRGIQPALVPWWIWASASAILGAIAGTGVYADGPSDLVAVPLVALIVALAVSKAAKVKPRTPRLAMACFGIATVVSTCVGLTILL